MNKLFTLLFAGVVWAAVFPALAARPGASEQAPAEFEEAPPGGDFILQSADGPVSLNGLQGKAVLIYFGYSKCPDLCPMSLAIMGQALNALAEPELTRVQGLFISLDPNRDTPANLKDFAAYFHPNLLGLTGSEEVVKQVAANYGVKHYQVERAGSALGYSVNHSSTVFLVDPAGELRFIFPHATPAGVLLEAVRYVLAEPRAHNAKGQ